MTVTGSVSAGRFVTSVTSTNAALSQRVTANLY